MAIQSVLGAGEKAELEKFTHDFNLKINEGRNPQQNLGKNDFLNLLMTQYKYQDPMAPMEDKESIAQMAQFSTLEQTTNMARDIAKMTGMAGDFAKLTELLSGSEAGSALGKSVELTQGDEIIQGSVKAITRGTNPQIMVNGTYYDWAKVTKVFED
ncbi:flagellar hook assembly protein FlgD [Spirochaetia bacterium]|nr:flagellar hook assembly protein FlgD [Spirochaetia bacterium]